MIRVLITGFGPYQEERDNPSGSIAESLDGTTVGPVSFSGCVLPVSARTAPKLLQRAIEECSPEVVLVTGVTPARERPALERVAINLTDYPIPDVDGFVAIDSPILAGAPAAYFSTLPIKAILANWRAAGIGGYVSNSAGTYLCNQLFYLAQHLTANTPSLSGLVHLPLPRSEPADAHLPLELLEDAVRRAAVVAATHVGPDLVLGAGSTS